MTSTLLFFFFARPLTSGASIMRHSHSHSVEKEPCGDVCTQEPDISRKGKQISYHRDANLWMATWKPLVRACTAARINQVCVRVYACYSAHAVCWFLIEEPRTRHEGDFYTRTALRVIGPGRVRPTSTR